MVRLLALFVALALNLLVLGTALADIGIYGNDGDPDCDICLAEPRPDPVISVFLDGTTGDPAPGKAVTMGKSTTGAAPGTITVSPLVAPDALAEPRPDPVLNNLVNINLN